MAAWRSAGPGGGADGWSAAEERWRVLLTVAPGDALTLARELAALRARASARKDPDPVTVRVDPPDPTA